MFRHSEDDQWEEHANRTFSIDLNEAIREQLERVDGEPIANDMARNLIGLLSTDDLSRLAFEGLSHRVGSYIRRGRRPQPRRKTNGSSRWDQVNKHRDALEGHYVQTGSGLKHLMDCTVYDLEGAVAYYTEKGNAYHARAKAYGEVKYRLKSQRGETVSDLDRPMVRRLLNV
jgi:hypothetical protein